MRICCTGPADRRLLGRADGRRVAYRANGVKRREAQVAVEVGGVVRDARRHVDVVAQLRPGRRADRAPLRPPLGDDACATAVKRKKLPPREFFRWRACAS